MSNKLFAKNLISTVLVAVCGAVLSTSVLAREPIDKTMDASAGDEIEINIVRGKIVIEGTTDNKISISGKLDEKTKEFIFERDGSSVNIELRLPRSISGGDDDGADLLVKMPRGANVTFNGVSIDVEAKEIAGEASINTISGNIQATRLGHEVALATVSGDIVLRGAGREVALTAISGDIKAHVTSEELSISTVSGDIQLNNEGKLRELSASTVSGDVVVKTGMDKNSEVSLSGISGRIELQAKGEINARVDADTGPGGEVINQWNDVTPESSMIGDDHLSMKVGDGSGEISISVVSGEIVLSREK